MARLTRPLDEHLHDPVDEEMVYRLWRGVGGARAHARGKKPLSWWRPALVGVGVGAMAVVVALVVMPPTGPEEVQPLALETADALPAAWATAGEAERVRLSDASELELAPETELAIVANHGGVFETRLVRGSVSMDIQPGGPRRHRIDCGIALVEVVGTRFALERTDAAVTVRVSRGRVRVTDRIRSVTRELGPGDAWTIEVDGAGDTASSPPSPVPAEPIEAVESADPGPTPSDPSRWRQLADQGRWEEAWEEVGPVRMEARTRTADGDELLALADVARQSGHPAAAVAPLETLLSRYPDDARAGLAAYTLGILRMDRLGQPGEAARAFERSLSAGLPSHLVEHALGRLAIAHARAGDEVAARAAARRYLARFPDGPMADDVRASAPGVDETEP